MNDPRRSLAFALEKYPDKVEVAPLAQLVMETARQNPKRPAWVKLAVPDEMVKTLRGSQEGGDLLLVVQVPGDVLERADSRIVLPGEVG
ncbi:MAG: hypothetical protein R3190_02490 [Thermoanaerobaculia bacterium]|nr:hypothetical protein [Thermoanaerobaculia bacterium]